MTGVEMGTRVAPTDLSESLNRVTVLDVRSPAEFESIHIPGSFNLPVDRLPEYFHEVRSAVSDPIVLVCRSGQRAQQAERELEAARLQELHVVDGGPSSWAAAGLPVVRGKQRWSMERQVRGVAGALVLVGLAASLKFRPLALLSAGVGGGLLFSAISDACTMARLLTTLSRNQGVGCDVSQVMQGIAAERQAPNVTAN